MHSDESCSSCFEDMVTLIGVQISFEEDSLALGSQRIAKVIRDEDTRRAVVGWG